MITFPKALYVGNNSIHDFEEESWDDIRRDPRGLVLMFEPPTKGAKYIMGLDPTEGRTGWQRSLRTDGDHKIDNGAIEIFRVNGLAEPIYKTEGNRRIPDIDPITKKQKTLLRDVQVCEFAAPCDAVEIARVANVLGRIYAGSDEDECPLIWEAWPGPGLLTTQELLRLGYGNLWHWQYISSVAEDTNQLGWRSTRESQKILWYRSRRHLMNRQALIRSQFLLDEYANAEIDMDKMRARAAYGYHDDRFQAANMCFWGGHEWSYNEDPQEEVTETRVLDYQQMAPTLDGYQSYAEWKEACVASWSDD